MTQHVTHGPSRPSQTKRRWTAAPARRTRSSTTCWSSCSLDTGRWRSGSPAPSASTTTSNWSSSADTPPASSAAPRSRPAPSAGRPSARGFSCSYENPAPPKTMQRRPALLQNRRVPCLNPQIVPCFRCSSLEQNKETGGLQLSLPSCRLSWLCCFQWMSVTHHPLWPALFTRLCSGVAPPPPAPQPVSQRLISL